MKAIYESNFTNEINEANKLLILLINILQTKKLLHVTISVIIYFCKKAQF